ncbi:MAG: glutathione S-transferase family protein [Candidatus Obscuribacterales bacterium]|nr:glutathione S-transferase family protein [Steroidobacteraceae bacterium]
MKLYNERNPAPNPRRVRIFLAEKGIVIPLEAVPLRERAHKSPEFKQKNSLGQVPVLELDDGSMLSESVSICRYLEELNPAPALFGNSALERARVDMWIRRVEFALMNPIAAVWVHTHPYTAGLGTQYKEYGEASRERVLSAMQWLDSELEGREFLAIDTYTMADIVALTTIDFAKFIGIDLPLTLRSMHDWYARVSARPSAAA